MQIPDCPNCSAPMTPTAASCECCQIEIRAKFTPNEFARLKDQDLGFLRVFVASEGRIKEMEKSLGVSYPTIKNLMAKLKQELNLEHTSQQESDSVLKKGKIKNAGQNHQH
jgi:hypothetical protein